MKKKFHSRGIRSGLSLRHLFFTLPIGTFILIIVWVPQWFEHPFVLSGSSGRFIYTIFGVILILAGLVRLFVSLKRTTVVSIDGDVIAVNGTGHDLRALRGVDVVFERTDRVIIMYFDDRSIPERIYFVNISDADGLLSCLSIQGVPIRQC